MRKDEMNRWQAKLVGIVLTLLLSGVQPILVVAQQSPSQPSAQDQQPPTADREQQEDKASQEIINRNHLPDSPGATRTPVSPEAPTTPPSTASSKSAIVEPTGTAAAQAGKVSGSAASRPAGAAIAPAKQRQVRSFLIKMGVIAGAGVALGSVAALSQASPSKPPGAR
jgi:hypothetical protein